MPSISLTNFPEGRTKIASLELLLTATRRRSVCHTPHSPEKKLTFATSNGAPVKPCKACCGCSCLDDFTIGGTIPIYTVQKESTWWAWELMRLTALGVALGVALWLLSLNQDESQGL